MQITLTRRVEGYAAIKDFYVTEEDYNKLSDSNKDKLLKGVMEPSSSVKLYRRNVCHMNEL